MSLCCSLNAIHHFSEIIAFLSASLSTSHLFCQNYTELSFNGLMTLCINSSAFRNILKCLLLQVLLLSLSLPHNSYILKQRSSHQMRSIKKFAGKHLCQSLFFNKAARFRPATLIKKETQTQVFSCKFCEIFKNTFFYRTHLDDCFWKYFR